MPLKGIQSGIKSIAVIARQFILIWQMGLYVSRKVMWSAKRFKANAANMIFLFCVNNHVWIQTSLCWKCSSANRTCKSNWLKVRGLLSFHLSISIKFMLIIIFIIWQFSEGWRLLFPCCIKFSSISGPRQVSRSNWKYFTDEKWKIVLLN